VDDTAGLIRELTDDALGRSPDPAMTPRPDRSQIGVELGVIERYGDVDRMPTPAGALTLVKRVVLRAAAFNWARQRAVNRSVLAALTILARENDELRAQQAQSVRRAAAATALSMSEIRLAIEDLGRSIDDLRARLGVDDPPETSTSGAPSAASDPAASGER
jgi:hypothetical protein